MTDEANGSVISAELYVALFSKWNNQRLSTWGKPFICFPDIVTDLCQNSYHALPACLNKLLGNIINSFRCFPFSVELPRPYLSHKGLVVELFWVTAFCRYSSQ